MTLRTPDFCPEQILGNVTRWHGEGKHSIKSIDHLGNVWRLVFWHIQDPPPNPVGGACDGFICWWEVDLPDV